MAQTRKLPEPAIDEVKEFPTTGPPKRPRKRYPRSAGLTKLASLKEWQEFSDQRYFRILYQGLAETIPIQEDRYYRPLYELLGSNRPDPLQVEAKSKDRKHLLRKLFRSDAGQGPQREMLVMASGNALALQRTSNGHAYGQILTKEVYDGTDGTRSASTYNINASRIPRHRLAEENDGNPTVFAKDKANAVAGNDRSIQKLDRLQKTTDVPFAQKSSEQEAPHGPTPSETVGSHELTTESVTSRHVLNRFRKEKVISGQRLSDIPKPTTEAPPAIPSPIHRTNDSMFGLSQEFSQIMARGDSPSKSTSHGQNPLASAKTQPTIRDFATHGSSFVKAARALRARSRSPAKRASMQQQQQQHRKILDFPHDTAFGPSSRNFEASFPQKRAPSLAEAAQLSHLPPAAPPTTPESIIRNPGHTLRPSPIAVATCSKPPSMISSETIAEDTASDASLAVVSNAQSAVLMRPPLPGPAPTRALPSLPEGHDAPTPVTPRASWIIASPESPTKFSPGLPGRVPPKSPARYRFTPTGSGSSPPKPKRPASPVRRNAVTELENIKTPFSSPERQTYSYSRPHQELLPKSITNGSTCASDLDQAQQKRIESTQVPKARDLQLTRMESQKADTEDAAMPGASAIVNEDELHQGIVELPSVRDSYDGTLISARHRAQQPSQVSELSLSTTALQQHRESVILSHRLSPIIVVAEQEPTLAIQRTRSQEADHVSRDSVDEYLQSRYGNSRVSSTSIDERPQRPTTNGFFPKPPKPASPSLQLPDDDSRSRPMSVRSMPPSRPASIQYSSGSRPVAVRVPTPFAEPLLRAQPNRTSQPSPNHYPDDLEARMAAMEKKNAMLENALIAVIDCSSRYNTSNSGIFRSGRSNDDGDRSSGASGRASLYAGLGNEPIAKANAAGARMSMASGP